MANVKKNKKSTVKKFTKTIPLFQDGEMKYGAYEYKMSKESAHDILYENGKKVPGDNATLLCDYVNSQYGLKGYCASVIVE